MKYLFLFLLLVSCSDTKEEAQEKFNKPEEVAALPDGRNIRS